MHLLVNWVANKWQHWHNILIFGSIVFLLGLKTLHKGNSGSENWPHILQKVHFKDFCQSLGFICGVDTKHKRYPLSKKCPYSELFWSAFSRIWTEYGDIRSISLYSVQMGENADQNNSEYGHFSRRDVHFRSVFTIQYSEPILVRIFRHPDWRQRDTSYLSVFSPNVGKYGLE